MGSLLDNQSPKLFSLLASVPGKKTLVLDRSLSNLISALASFSQLQDHGIDSVQWLEKAGPFPAGASGDSPTTKIVIVSRPNFESITLVAELIKTSHGRDFTLVLLPRRTLLSDSILTQMGVLADVDVRVLPIKCIQEDTDLICVDVPTINQSSSIVTASEVFSIAQTLMDLQRQHGMFNRLLGKGIHSEALASQLKQNRAGILIEEQAILEEDGLFGDCIILDRQTDLITPLLTQLTYEGLLYETYPISANVLELPATIQNNERKITLGPNDVIFADLRGDNFANVGEKLKGTATNLSAELDSRHQMNTTTQLKAFVSQIPSLQASQKHLKIHIELTELLLAKTRTPEFREVLEIEQSLYTGSSESDISTQLAALINQQIALTKILRIICLWSQIHNGLKQKDYDFFYSRILQTYGYEAQLTLNCLNNKGLFIIRSATTEKGRGAWYGFSRTWKLITEEENQSSPTDIGYLYAGFAPLNLRILQGYLQHGFFERSAGKSALAVPTNARLIDSMMKNLRGPNVDLRQTSQRRKMVEERVLVVVFLGGFTATEVAGVRFIAKQLGREILMVGKGMIRGTNLIEV